MRAETQQSESFRVERHGDIGVIIPASEVESLSENLIQQAAWKREGHRMKRHNGRRGNDAFQELNDDEIQHEEARQPLTDDQLVQQIKVTADKLIRDQCNRGDLKLLTTALKELRYAFKVF